MLNVAPKNVTCSGFVVASHDDQAIILVFRPTHGQIELAEEECKYMNNVVL